MVDERLSALDTAFLCLESVHAPMHLGALAIFHPPTPVKPNHIISLLSDRAGRLPWLRRRVGLTWLPPGAGVWVEDRLFNAKRHVHLHQLDGGGPDEVAASAAELMADPLNLNRPLWQLHLMTGLPDGQFALLVKLHHALADGLRAAELGLSLLDGFTDAAADRASRPPVPVAASALTGVLRTARSMAGSAAGLALRPEQLVGHLAGAADLMRRPEQLLGHLAGAAGQVASAAGQLADAAAGAAAGVPSVARHVADMAGIAGSILSSARLGGAPSPLSTAPAGTSPNGRGLALLRLDVGDIRQVRRRHGGTDNDVLLAIITGALRTWLAHRGESVDSLNLRALIPVSRRARPEDRRRGNLLSGYLCDLPVHESDPVAQLRRIRTTMDRNKAAGPGRGAGAIPVLADRVPSAMHRVVTPLTRTSAGRLFDTIVTNVPIPAIQLTLGGAPLREVYPIAPLAEGHTLGIAMSAHRGTVHLGLHTNGRALPDLQRLAVGVPAALATLTAVSQAC